MPAKGQIIPIRERFLRHVHIAENGCWEWTAARDKDGYGFFKVGGKQRRAHRVSWEIHIGPVPPGMDVLHSCDNPPCVKPTDLFLGTNTDNARDAAQKGRLAFGESNAMSKLTWPKVRSIRADYATDPRASHQSLADKHGVTANAIKMAIANLTWTDPTYDPPTKPKQRAPWDDVDWERHSQAMRARDWRPSEEHLAALKRANSNRDFTEEHRLKIKRALTGRSKSAAHAAQIRSNAHRSLDEIQQEDVLRRFRDGATFVEIAADFFVSPTTIARACGRRY